MGRFKQYQKAKSPIALSRGLKEQKETMGMALKSAPHIQPRLDTFFLLKKLVTGVGSSRESPVGALAHLSRKLDYPLSGTCFDLLSDTIVVSCDLYKSLTSVERLGCGHLRALGQCINLKTKDFDRVLYGTLRMGQVWLKSASVLLICDKGCRVTPGCNISYEKEASLRANKVLLRLQLAFRC